MDIAEKRVFDDRTGATLVLVAAATGLARVAVSGDAVGEFGLVHRGPVRDVAAAGGRVALATPADVHVGEVVELTRDGPAPTGFGPADAVGFDGETLLAAGEGRVARHEDGVWTATGEVPDVRAVDDGLLAAGEGLFRVDGTYVGLSDARDVAAAGPLAATGDGLYRLANGWVRAREGAFRAVAAAAGRAHAATAVTVYARGDDPGVWADVGAPVDDVVDVGAGPAATYVVTADGTVCVDAGGGWRTRQLGLADVAALAVTGIER